MWDCVTACLIGITSYLDAHGHWNYFYDDVAGNRRDLTGNFDVTGTGLYVRTIQTWQRNLASVLANKTIMMSIDCKAGLSCLLFCVGVCNNYQVNVHSTVSGFSSVEAFNVVAAEWSAVLQHLLGSQYSVGPLSVSMRRTSVVDVQLTVVAPDENSASAVSGKMSSSTFKSDFNSEFSEHVQVPQDYKTQFSDLEVIAFVGN